MPEMTYATPLAECLASAIAGHADEIAAVATVTQRGVVVRMPHWPHRRKMHIVVSESLVDGALTVGGLHDDEESMSSDEPAPAAEIYRRTLRGLSKERPANEFKPMMQVIRFMLERKPSGALDPDNSVHRELARLLGRVDTRFLELRSVSAGHADHEWLGKDGGDVRYGLVAKHPFAERLILARKDLVDGLLSEGRSFPEIVFACVRDARLIRDEYLAGRRRRSRVLRAIAELPPSCTNPGVISNALNKLPYDKLPADGAQWRAFSLLEQATSGISEDSRFLIDIPHGDYQGAWKAIEQSLLGRTLVAGARGWGDQALDTPEIIARGFRTAVEEPVHRFMELVLAHVAPDADGAYSRRTLYYAAKALIHRNKGLGGLLETYEAFHGIQTALAAAHGNFSGVDSWRSLAERKEHRVDGYVLRFLTTAEELHYEGHEGRDTDGHWGLEHCVASHVGLCLAGGSHILSIRRTGEGGRPGERVSTAEIRMERGGRFKVVQHLGRLNAEPESGAVEAFGRFRGILGTADAPLDPQAARYVSPDDLIRRMGAISPEVLADRLRAFDPLLPRPLRGLTPAAFYEASGMAEAMRRQNEGEEPAKAFPAL